MTGFFEMPWASIAVKISGLLMAASLGLIIEISDFFSHPAIIAIIAGASTGLLVRAIDYFYNQGERKAKNKNSEFSRLERLGELEAEHLKSLVRERDEKILELRAQIEILERRRR